MQTRSISGATAMTGRIAAVLVVPHGTHRPEPLAAALRALHPTWDIGAVWCGDPHLRPRLDGVEWYDARDTDEVAIVAGDPLVGEWRRAVDVTAGLLANGVDRVALLWVGSTAVMAAIDPLIEATLMTLIARAPEPLPDDGLAPSEADLAVDGLYSTSAAGFGTAAAPALAWLMSHLAGTANVGQLLARAGHLFGVEVCAHPAIGVGRWRWGSTGPALLDVAGYDTRTPWTLDANAEQPMRIELLGNPDRQAAMAAAAPQLAGERTPLYLPGGLEVDATIRQAVAEPSSPPPAPWSAAAEFRAWLAP
ncbi:MAG: hypothetical protein ABI862_06010, partial [Ilumatobacteraceae bacterium]